MLATTKGIVLKYIKYRETSIIATIYTEEFGVQSYMVKGIRSPKNKKGIGYFQAMMLLDMVVYHKENRDIFHLSEWKMSDTLYDVYSDLRKSSLCLFLAELLYKSMKESESSKETFFFTYQSVRILESLSSGLSGFHIQFMVKLARYLGFGLDHYFSYTDHEIEKLIKEAGDCSYGEFKLPAKTRENVLGYLVDYYSTHISGFGKLKSHEILKEIFA